MPSECSRAHAPSNSCIIARVGVTAHNALFLQNKCTHHARKRTIAGGFFLGRGLRRRHPSPSPSAPPSSLAPSALQRLSRAAPSSSPMLTREITRTYHHARTRHTPWKKTPLFWRRATSPIRTAARERPLAVPKGGAASNRRLVSPNSTARPRALPAQAGGVRGVQSPRAPRRRGHWRAPERSRIALVSRAPQPACAAAALRASAPLSRSLNNNKPPGPAIGGRDGKKAPAHTQTS